MLPIAIFLLILFAMAFGFAWIADNPGTVTINWLGAEMTLSMVQAITLVAVLTAIAMIIWALISFIIRGPAMFDRWRKGRKRDKGFDALSRGLIAAGAGNASLARQLTRESRKHLDDEPLVAVLDAQTTLLEGDRMAVREKFAAMMEREETRGLGLRGLYLEAEREGVDEAAVQYALAANFDAPGTPWATKAVLKDHVMSGKWDEALAALTASRTQSGLDKTAYERQRAVLLTAKAMEAEAADPQTAKGDALRAHKLAPTLVPAALVAARIAARLGDIRKAAKVLETTWKESPHPNLADAYVTLRAGDSLMDRMARVDALEKVSGTTLECHFIRARTALEAGEFKTARRAAGELLRTAPSKRACLLMADIEEAEHDDQGRVREWLSRAVHAPRDAAWTADGYIAEDWAPFSPVTGELDAFEWRVPVEQIGGTAQPVDYESLLVPPMKPMDEIEPVETQVAASKMSDVIDVEPVIEEEKSVAKPERDADSTAGITKRAGASGDKGVKVEAEPRPKAAKLKKKAPAKAKPAKKRTERNRNLDEDGDGRLDRAPDDPGIREGAK
jgi:HemY protein